MYPVSWSSPPLPHSLSGWLCSHVYSLHSDKTVHQYFHYCLLLYLLLFEVPSFCFVIHLLFLIILPGHTSIFLLFLCHIVPSKYYAFFSFILLFVYPFHLEAYSRNKIPLQGYSMSLSKLAFPYSCS